MIIEKIDEDRMTGRFSVIPFHDRAVQASADASMRIVRAVLADPRMDEFIADMMRENIDQIHADVQRHGVQHAIRNVGVADPLTPRTTDT
jgi:hypothetical protein